MLMINKGGRPKSENSKQSSMSVRMSSADYDKVKKYAADHHQTISKVVLEALNLLYNKEENAER